MHALSSFLFRRDVILIAFIIITAINAVITVAGNYTPDAMATGVLSVIVFSVLGWFTWKRNPIATWVLCIIMLLNGTGMLMAAYVLASGEVEPNVLHGMIALLTGVYITYGGVTLFRTRHGD